MMVSNKKSGAFQSRGKWRLQPLSGDPCPLSRRSSGGVKVANAISAGGESGDKVCKTAVHRVLNPMGGSVLVSRRQEMRKDKNNVQTLSDYN